MSKSEICRTPYSPREGTETISFHRNFDRQYCIATYLPREGPETIQVSHTNLHLNHKEHPTHLGRGRKRVTRPIKSPIILRRTTYSPR